MSDASYLSRPKARSVCGHFGYLDDTTAINGPILCGSWMIDCVCASVAEAETAGGFHAIQAGYPQPPTVLRMDNTVALGIASGTMNAKRSKSMDMRFFWIIDRVEQGQFIVSHVPGIWNIADHFTKPLPKDKFDQFTQFLIVNTDNEPKTDQLKTSTVTFPKEM